MSRHHERPGGYCFGCLPLRTGVLIFISYSLFIAVCAVISLLSEDTRLLVGGYDNPQRCTVEALGCIGVLLSLMGLLGIQDNSTRWVKYFLYFTAVVLLLRAWIFMVDFRDLKGCEKLARGVITSVNGNYNPAMEYIAVNGFCPGTRWFYSLVSVTELFVGAYGLWITYRWCHYLDHGATYHISIDDTKPMRIYTGYSTVGHPEAPPPINVVPPPSTQPAGHPQYGNNAGHPRSQNHLAPPPQSGFMPPSSHHRHAPPASHMGAPMMPGSYASHSNFVPGSTAAVPM